MGRRDPHLRNDVWTYSIFQQKQTFAVLRHLKQEPRYSQILRQNEAKARFSRMCRLDFKTAEQIG